MILQVLKEVPLFRGLSESQLQQVAEIATIKGVLARVPLFSKGDPSDCMYVVSRGRVRILIPADAGTEERTVELGPGGFFGEMGIMTGSPRMADAVVSEDAVLVRIPRRAFDRLMALDDAVAEKVMNAYMERVTELKASQKEATAVSEARALEARSLLFFSAGGGAGASFLVANLALKIKDLTRKEVLVLDLDGQGPTQHLYLGLSDGAGGLPKLLASGEVTATGVKKHARRLHSGVDLIGGPGVLAEGKLTGTVAGALVRAAAEVYDYVLVDTTSALGPQNDALFETCDVTHVVIGPDIVSVSRSIPVVKHFVNSPLEPRLRLVLNKFMPNEGLRPQAIEEKFGRSVLGRIELEQSLALEAVNEGLPLVKRTPRCTAAVDVTRFARETLSQLPIAEAPAGAGFSLWNLLGG